MHRFYCFRVLQMHAIYLRNFFGHFSLLVLATCYENSASEETEIEQVMIKRVNNYEHMNDCKRHKNRKKRKKLIRNDEKRVHIKFMSFENIMHVPDIRYFSFVFVLCWCASFGLFSMSSLLLTGINL